MKIKVPATTIEACDICKRHAGGLLTKCVRCGKDYCHICEAIMGGCIKQPKLCKVCGALDEARAVVQKFAKSLVVLLAKRDKALAATK